MPVRSRRDFIACSALGTVMLGAGDIANADAFRLMSVELLALHTNEYIKTPYRLDGEVITKSLPAIDHLLRDHRTDEVHSIDPELLDYLHDLKDILGMTGPFHVISGYRSPATNEQLRSVSNGVAKRSLHMFGRAIDLRVPDVPTGSVRDAAIEMKRGGVGFYPRSDFVHLDTGRFRYW